MGDLKSKTKGITELKWVERLKGLILSGTSDCGGDVIITKKPGFGLFPIIFLRWYKFAV